MLDEELFVVLLLLLDFFCLLLEDDDDEAVGIDVAVKGSTGRLEDERDC